LRASRPLAASSEPRSTSAPTAGWVGVSAFNDEPFADHWFEKALA
jgi:hypothetical protein